VIKFQVVVQVAEIQGLFLDRWNLRTIKLAPVLPAATLGPLSQGSKVHSPKIF